MTLKYLFIPYLLLCNLACWSNNTLKTEVIQSITGNTIQEVTTSGDNGFIVEEYNEKAEKKSKVKKCFFAGYNTDLELVDTISIQFSKFFFRYYSGTSEGFTHVIYKHVLSKKFLIVSINHTDFSLQTKEVKFKDYVLGDEGIVVGNRVWFYNKHKGQEMVYINWVTGEFGRFDIEVPNVKNKFLIPFDIRLLDSEEILLFTRNDNSKEIGTRVIRYTSKGEYIENYFSPGKRAVSVNVKEFKENDFLIWGSYSDGSINFETGYYSFKVEGAKTYEANYFDFRVLEGFINDRKRNYKKGCHLDQKQLLSNGESNILFAEVFYWLQHKDAQGKLIYDGDAHTHSLMLSFDNHGQFNWHTIFLYDKEKYTYDIIGKPDLFYLKDNNIFIGGYEVNSSFDSESGKLISSNDELEEREFDGLDDDFQPWYGNVKFSYKVISTVVKVCKLEVD